MRDPNDWDTVSPGFKLEPPIVRRSRGRPRNLKIRASQTHDKGSRLGVRNNKYKRCGGFGHIKRLCDGLVVHQVQKMQRKHKDDQVHDHEVQDIQPMHLDDEVHDHLVQELHDVHEILNCRHQVIPPR